jgi:hypothetical protein
LDKGPGLHNQPGNKVIAAGGEFYARRTAILYGNINRSLSKKQFSGHCSDVIIMLYPPRIGNAVNLEIYTFARPYVKSLEPV